MANCKLCTGFDDCPFRVGLDTPCWYYKQKPMSNGDRIRAMTDEELANWLGIYCRGAIPVNEPCVNSFNSCEDCWLDWLRKEMEE